MTNQLTKRLLLDVRSQEAYARQHVKGAVNCPLEEVLSGAVALDKETRIAVYCQLGQRSERAVTFLKEQGYKDVENLGGIEAVAALGLIEREGDDNEV